MSDPVDFIHALNWDDLPAEVRAQVKLNLLDLLGVAAGGLGTRLSGIIRDHAADSFGGTLPMLFDARRASPLGVALAAGMTIDALDGHDGFNPAKGHIGCPLFAGLLPMALRRGLSGRDMLAALVMGYEFGARASVAQHATVPDYHTSGSWGAVTVAAAGARVGGLDRQTTRHALGIAEYHGPRSQMMRCIDHPSMLKDGAGWGAMAGVSAVDLAAKGFTGAPAITVEDAPGYWQGLGSRWLILEQYYKPYPVCRWAQAPVEAILALRKVHGLVASDVDHIEIETFHESVRLATRRPRTTEEAQYSTSFPCAVAMLKGGLTAADIADDALSDPELLRLSERVRMREADRANEAFPARRLARVDIVLKDGRRLQSDWQEPGWDPSAPPSASELGAKYMTLAAPVLGDGLARAIAAVVEELEARPFSDLAALICAPVG